MAYHTIGLVNIYRGNIIYTLYIYNIYNIIPILYDWDYSAGEEMSSEHVVLGRGDFMLKCVDHKNAVRV